MKKKMTPTQKQWLTRIKKQQSSNLSQSQYCEKFNIPKSSFSSMKCQLLQNGLLVDQQHQECKKQSLFISTKTKDDSSSIKIKFSNGLELSFNKIPDSDWMGKVLSSIGGENVINKKL